MLRSRLKSFSETKMNGHAELHSSHAEPVEACCDSRTTCFDRLSMTAVGSKRFLPIIIILFALSSCSLFIEPMPKSWKWGFKPRPLTGVRNFPSTDSEYGKGFKDGCGTGFDAMARGLLSDINEHKYDFKRMQKSPDYNTGWTEGFQHCTDLLDHDVN